MKTLMIIAVWMCSVSALAQWQRVEMTDAEAAEIIQVGGIGQWTIITTTQSSFPYTRSIWRTLDFADRTAWERGLEIHSGTADLKINVHHDRVYAVVRDTTTRVLVSMDSAQTFQEVTPAWTFVCESTIPNDNVFQLRAPGPALYAVCSRSYPWRSLDDGATWTPMQPTSGECNGFWAADSAVVLTFDHQYIPGMPDTAWMSVDLGETWTRLILPVDGWLIGVGHGAVVYAQVRNDEMAYRSTDRGRTWSQSSAYAYTIGCHTAVVPVGNVDMTVGLLMHSTDLGASWRQFDEGMGPTNCHAPNSYGNVEALHPTQDDLLARVSVPSWPAFPEMGGKPAWFRRRMSEVVVSVDESVDGSRFAVRDEQYLRGSVPYTTLRVDRDVTVDMFNVLGERVGSYRLEAGEHHLDTPMPTLLIMKPLRR